ncbi:unnamed protein product, partial [Effrenium voratum]
QTVPSHAPLGARVAGARGRGRRRRPGCAVRLRPSNPQLELELRTNSAGVDDFEFCLLPLPGPVGTLQSPPPAHAQLPARTDLLTAELETEKLQKACDEDSRRFAGRE